MLEVMVEMMTTHNMAMDADQDLALADYREVAILRATKTPLQNWICAIYSVVTACKGVCAMQLSKELGVQYRTAWYMLHRIREACGEGEFGLANAVEMDECYVGGKETNKHANKKLGAGRGAVGKVPVMGARERGGTTVAKPVESADQKTATGFAAATVKEGSTVYTDQSRIYCNLPFTHASVNHGAGEYVRGDAHQFSGERVGRIQAFAARNMASSIEEAPAPLCEGSDQAVEHWQREDWHD